MAAPTSNGSEGSNWPTKQKGAAVPGSLLFGRASRQLAQAQPRFRAHRGAGPTWPATSAQRRSAGWASMCRPAWRLTLSELRRSEVPGMPLHRAELPSNVQNRSLVAARRSRLRLSGCRHLIWGPILDISLRCHSSGCVETPHAARRVRPGVIGVVGTVLIGFRRPQSSRGSPESARRCCGVAVSISPDGSRIACSRAIRCLLKRGSRLPRFAIFWEMLLAL